VQEGGGAMMVQRSCVWSKLGWVWFVLQNQLFQNAFLELWMCYKHRIPNQNW